MKFPRPSPLTTFFILSYAIFWGIWFPLIPHLQGLAEFDLEWWVILLALIGIYAPTWAALITVAYSEGGAGLRSLVAPLLDWRISPRWYFLALGTPIFVAMLAILFDTSISDLSELQSVDWLTAVTVVMTTAPFVLLAKLPLGPMAEELGWRGFALPRLQRSMSALAASILLGNDWALWHLPAFWVPGAALPLDETPGIGNVLAYTIDVVGVSIIFTWIYNNTRGSLLIDFLFHAAYNAFPALLFGAVGIFPNSSTWIIWLFAIGIVVRYGPANLAAIKVTKLDKSVSTKP